MHDAIEIFGLLLSSCGLFALITGFFTKIYDIKIAGNGFTILSQIISFNLAETNLQKGLTIFVIVTFIFIDARDRYERKQEKLKELEKKEK